MKYPIALTVNGRLREAFAEPGGTLISLLREEFQLTGGKVACGIGDCGACTVILNGKAVKACLVPAMKADGADVLTIEGLGENGLHPLQRQFIEKVAIQCGYCSPGFILAAKAFLDENPNPSEDEVREAIAGNICRCTGYAKPVAAILAAAEIIREGDDHGKDVSE